MSNKTEDFDRDAFEYDQWFERNKIEYALE